MKHFLRTAASINKYSIIIQMLTFSTDSSSKATQGLKENRSSGLRKGKVRSCNKKTSVIFYFTPLIFREEKVLPGTRSFAVLAAEKLSIEICVIKSQLKLNGPKARYPILQTLRISPAIHLQFLQLWS